MSIIGDFPNHLPNISLFVPSSFTTLLTAHTAQIYTPLKEDYQDNPWLSIICMGITIRYPSLV
jgi:hypothetical protein